MKFRSSLHTSKCYIFSIFIIRSALPKFGWYFRSYDLSPDVSTNLVISFPHFYCSFTSLLFTISCSIFFSSAIIYFRRLFFPRLRSVLRKITLSRVESIYFRRFFAHSFAAFVFIPPFFFGIKGFSSVLSSKHMVKIARDE